MRTLALLAALVLLTAACGGDDDAKPTPSPETIAPAATATAASSGAPAPPSQVMVRWEPVSRAELDLYDGGEVANPWPAPMDQPERPQDTIRWSLNAGEVGSAPRTVYETTRRLIAPSWSADGSRIMVTFFSKSDQPPEPNPYANALRGHLWFDSASLSQTAEVRISGLSRVQTYPGPDGRQLGVVQDPLRGLLIHDPQTGATRKLTGIDNPHLQSWPSSWSPDSRYLLIGSVPPGPPNWRGPDPYPWYLVPLDDGPARLITVSNTTPNLIWSSFDPTIGVLTNGDGLWLIKMPSGTLQRLSAAHTSPGAGLPSWLSPARVQVGNDVIDIVTGQVTSYPVPPNLPPGSNYPNFVSPDGRYLATPLLHTQPGHPDRCEPPESRSNRVFLYDRQQDRTSLIWDCDKPVAASTAEWLADSRNLLLVGANCWACEPSTWSATLKDVVSGRETPLTNGLEFGAMTEVSPDGTKVLVMGKALRVYSQTGDLLQRIDAPPGFAVIGASWAPDSKRYVYVIGPDGSYGI